MSEINVIEEIPKMRTKGASPEITPRSHTGPLGNGTPITSLLYNSGFPKFTEYTLHIDVIYPFTNFVKVINYNKY